MESRLARGWGTQERARAEIARLTGWSIPHSVYAEWESGRRLPSDANLERLAAFYGGSPDAQAQEQSDVVAAIDRLTAAVEAQTRTQEGIAQGFAEVLAEIAARLAAAPSQTPNGSVGQ